jgi:thymidylate kinase (EC 2.7.4.9)
MGIDYIITREPGGTQIGEKIRDIIVDNKNSAMGAETEALLFAASRAQHVHEKILPSLEEGKVVVCDRFLFQV